MDELKEKRISDLRRRFEELSAELSDIRREWLEAHEKKNFDGETEIIGRETKLFSEVSEIIKEYSELIRQVPRE